MSLRCQYMLEPFICHKVHPWGWYIYNTETDSQTDKELRKIIQKVYLWFPEWCGVGSLGWFALLPLSRVAAVPLYILLMPPSLYNCFAQSMGPAYFFTLESAWICCPTNKYVRWYAWALFFLNLVYVITEICKLLHWPLKLIDVKKSPVIGTWFSPLESWLLLWKLLLAFQPWRIEDIYNRFISYTYISILDSEWFSKWIDHFNIPSPMLKI